VQTFVFRALQFHQTHPDWHLIPRSAFQYSSGSLLLHAAPLLEEKWDFGSQELIPDIRDNGYHRRGYEQSLVVISISYNPLANPKSQIGNHK
jgi:hypothetical protein